MAGKRMPPSERLTEIPRPRYRPASDLVASPEALPAIFEHPRTNLRTRRRRQFVRDPRWPERIDKLANRVESCDPFVALRAIALLKIRIRHRENELIVQSRDEGWPWWTIAWRLGISKQAAHARYRRRKAATEAC